jgi:hypothetical protein
MNKRGEERIFTIWWFVVIVLVSVAVVLATLGFFSKETNTRQYEANILYERILECLVQNGHLRSDFNENFNIYQACNFSKGALESGLFYFSIILDDKLILEGGDKSKRGSCSIALSDKVKVKDELGCVNRTEIVLYSVGEDLKRGKIQVLTSSSQDSGGYSVGGKNE